MGMLVVNSDYERLYGKKPEPTPEEIKGMYFTIRPLGEGNVTITIPKDITSSYATSLSYSVNREDWIDTVIDDTDQTISIPVSKNDLYLKGISNKAWGRTGWNRTSPSPNTSTTIASDVDFEVLGNPLSLFYGDDFINYTVLPLNPSYDDFYTALGTLFANNTHLISAEHLLLDGIGSRPADFFGMFYNCSNLVKGPKKLDWDHTRTDSKSYIFKYMFRGCTSLTTAPELPATTLVNECYYGMFNGCTSLTTSPELPATTLSNSCYYDMFNGCTNLNYIKILATDISASNALNNWLNSVSPTGTFVKPAGVEYPTGASGIPEGWTVEEI